MSQLNWKKARLDHASMHFCTCLLLTWVIPFISLILLNIYSFECSYTFSELDLSLFSFINLGQMDLTTVTQPFLSTVDFIIVITHFSTESKSKEWENIPLGMG